MGTFEEAALTAHGEMFRVYGDDTEPLPVTVNGDIIKYEGRAVWRLDADGPSPAP